MPGSGLTLSQLSGVTSMAAELRDAWLKELTTGLHICTLSDKLAFIRALDTLKGGAGGAANI